MSAQILSFTQLKKTIKNQDGNSIVLVGGCFDILHLGHVVFLEKAKKMGDILVVLLEHDQNVTQKKGLKRPFNSQKDRAKVLAALKAVDLIVMLPLMKNDSQYDEIVKLIRPRVIAVTKGDTNLHHKKRSAKMIEAKVKVVTKRVKEHSSSNLTKFIQK